MKPLHNVQLRLLNTLNFSSVASTFYAPKTIEELMSIPEQHLIDAYILGEGSNTLFVDQHSPVIIRPAFSGFSISENDDCYIVNAAASQNWHELVTYCVESDIGGLENLALIPGSVGAAPVQNIGAYGVELADFLEQVKWFEFSSRSIKVFDKKDCEFSYRESIFKQSLLGKGVITEVILKLPKKWQATLNYQGLSDINHQGVTAKEVYQRVIELRQAKLPDPKAIPNVGSFFKNPIIPTKQLDSLKVKFPNIVSYPVNEKCVKLAAGWLIDQLGFKGYKQNGVGVHHAQALVLVNFTATSGKEMVKLAKLIADQVKQKYDVTLEPEVRMITTGGLTKMDTIHG